MIRTYVKIKGLRELQSSLKELPESVSVGVLAVALKKAGAPVAEKAASLAPVRTGRLKRSIQVGSQLTRVQRAITPRLSRVEIYIGVRNSLSRGVWQEFGTVKHEPRPFMRPAWDALRNSVLESIKSLIWAEIKKAAESLGAKSKRATSGD